MAAFVLIILVGITVIYAIANQATRTEFRAYMFRGGMAQTDQIARDFADYYAARGSWQNVDAYFDQAFGLGMGAMMGGRGRGSMASMMGDSLFLADASGVVVASRDGSGIGQKMPDAQIARGVPIQVNGKIVGTLIAQSLGTTAFDALQQEFLERVNASILLAGIAAGAIAIVIGFVLFYQITAPLNALASAARKIATGDLSARVANPRDDEIGQVGRAFNAMADSLAKSEAARRNMIADIAHELRNPLGVVQGQLEGMIDGVFPTTPQQIASIYDETRLLTRLVDDLRDLALADAGQLRIARAPTDLRALIERVIATFAPQAAEKKIALESEIADGLPKPNADAQRIEQVLRNLVSNALRHTPEGGAVSVQCTVNSERSIKFSVRDTGAGIPSEDLPRVFERFWRGDRSRSRVGGGAGLGLAIAKQLVDAHGGEIGAESAAGEGATFWFTLPA
jgi:two-component system OmpR family sensor kinase/two-component system sensor histidine kinase BaeS